MHCLSKKLTVLWTTLFCFSSISFADGDSTSAPFLQKGWLNLLHYKQGLFGGFKSQIDGLDFFLGGKDGITSPEAEWNATKLAFSKDPKNRCKFPARSIYLDGVHPLKDCPEYERFFHRIGAQRAALVFSAYYLNNPSSAFGHTLLRLGKTKDADNELQDYGINYAALSTTSNAVAYAISGLAGFFRGTYTHIPYYYKIREYNDYEERDLWSYELNLSQSELDLVVAHAWELGSTHFDYYYLTENCSYHVLSLLEAAAPRLELTKRLPYWVIPADTVKVVYDYPGLVKGVSWRPSARSTFRRRLDSLTPEEQFEFSKFAGNPFEAPLPTNTNALDAALDYIDATYAKQLLNEGSDAALLRQRLLMARARIPTKSPALDLSMPQSDRPHLSHGSLRWGATPGYDRQMGKFLELQLRFALHDLQDHRTGYPADSQIEFLHLRTRVNVEEPKRSSRLFRIWEFPEFTLFRVTSLNTAAYYSRSPSWRVDLGLKQMKDLNCDRCMAGGGEAGIGYTIGSSHNEAFRLYSFLDGHFSMSPSYRDWARLAFGPKLGTIFRHQSIVSLSIESFYRYALFSEFPHWYGFQGKLRVGLHKDLALEARAVSEARNQEAALSLFYFL